MSDSPPASAPVPPPAKKSPAAPLFLWLVLQLIALSLAVFRIPLTARFPLPGEQFALHVMLITQIVAPALLFPFLLRDVKTSAMVILSILPFVQLSSYLSSIPITRVALAALYVAVWLLTLAIWRVILDARRTEMAGVAFATSLSLGGAVIWYVYAEAREPGAIDWSHDGLFGPILGAIAQLHAAPSSPWIVLLSLLILGAGVVGLTQKRAVGRSGSSPTTR